MTTSRPDPWAQRPDESNPAYAAFVTYRDQGLERSGAKTASSLGKSKTLIDRWSSRHAWVIRCRAWDAQQDREYAVEVRLARRRAEQRNVRVAGVMMNKAVQALTDLDTSKMKAQDIARMVEVASKLEALTFGTATERVEHTGVGGGPVQVDMSKLTDEERHARMVMLQRELAARLADADPDDQDDDR